MSITLPIIITAAAAVIVAYMKRSVFPEKEIIRLSAKFSFLQTRNPFSPRPSS